MKKVRKYLANTLKLLLRLSTVVVCLLYPGLQLGDSAEPIAFEQIMEDREKAFWFWSTIVGYLGFLFAWFSYRVGISVIILTVFVLVVWVHPVIGFLHFLFLALPCLIFIFTDIFLSMFNGECNEK